MRIAMAGAASGIGAAALKRFKRAGHEIHAFDIAEVDGADRWVQVDFADPDAVRRAAAAADGPFDALICNVGVPPRPGNAVPLLVINVLGLVAFAEAMLDKLPRGARIVTTASRAGQDWRANAAEAMALLALRDAGQIADFVARRQIDPTRAYCLSKEALIVWTVLKAEELAARGIGANTVSPSGVDTAILDDFKRALGARAERAMARAGRPGTAEEIAALIDFLAGPESSWIHGQDITIDGGMTAFATADALRGSGNGAGDRAGDAPGDGAGNGAG